MTEKQNLNLTPEQFAALVEQAKTGDQEAYTALYRATDQEVYRTVRSMVKAEDTALDIQQDAYVYAFTHLEQLGEPGKFRSWLRSIAVNRTRSVLRKQTPVLFSELETEEGAGIPELADPSPEGSPELRLERQETADYVREILDGLTVGQRMLVGMYYYEQLPVGKIAEDLGVSPGTVKTQLFRSRRKIEAAVKGLEKKGVKLFGLAPIPFLTALLKRQEPAAEAGKALMAETFTRAGIAPAAEAVGLHVGRSFFQTALGRVVLGVIAAGVVAGGVAGYRWAKNNLVIGDVRPTETLEIELHYDTAEDLTTEPTLDTEIPSTEADTEEDLVPDTTEPEESTEPEASTEPTDPAPQPTDPAPQPTDPAPTDPAPRPTDPTNPAGGDDPGGPDPAETTEPSEADETEKPTPNTASARITSYDWGSPGTRELYDIPWGNGVYIHITVLGEEQPSVTTDNSDLIRHIKPETEYNYSDPSTGEHHYFWSATIGNSGTGHVYCSLSGEVQGVLTLQNPEYKPCIVKSYWNDSYNTSDKSFIGTVGDKVKLYLQVQGKEKPVLTVNNPAVAQIVMETPLEGSGITWNTREYVWKIQLTGSGSAELRCTLGGTLAGSFTITAEQADVEP